MRSASEGMQGSEDAGPDPVEDREIELAPGVRLRRSECRLSPLRSGGPGGQNVNKVSNGVELRWSVADSPSLDERARERLRKGLARRINSQGELVLRAVEFRERPRNVEAVFERLQALAAEALKVRATRRPTRPTRGAQRRRRAAKQRRSEVKRDRRAPPSEA